MKKSEVINLIIKHIDGMIRPESQRIFAIRLLAILEQAGMSPPDYDGTVYGYNEGHISPPEWEPEDEKT